MEMKATNLSVTMGVGTLASQWFSTAYSGALSCILRAVYMGLVIAKERTDKRSHNFTVDILEAGHGAN
jgi:hypothetical protein